MHIVDDEQRRDCLATPMRPSGSGGARASAALALLDDVQRHHLRRAVLHLPSRRSKRGPSEYSDGLLNLGLRVGPQRANSSPLLKFSTKEMSGADRTKFFHRRIWN